MKRGVIAHTIFLAGYGLLCYVFGRMQGEADQPTNKVEYIYVKPSKERAIQTA